MPQGPPALLQHCRRLAAEMHASAALPDGELVQRFGARGDPRAFESLLRRHGPMVWGVCRRLLACEQDAEDVFQATFLVLTRKAATLRRRESVAAWLHGVAHRLAARARADAHKRKARERGARARPAPDALAEITGRELRAVLDEELARLPERLRAPVLLCFLQGATRDEAARRLGLPLGTLKSRLERGRQLLRARLARRGLALSAALLAAQLAGGAALPAAVLTSVAKAARLSRAAEVPGLCAGPQGAGLRAVFAGKAKVVLTALVIVAVTIAGVGLGAQQGRLAPPPAPKPEDPRPGLKNDARTDRYGDPLPPRAIRRLGTLRFRQGGGPINSLLLSRDGKTLISNTYYEGGTVCAWELATGKLLRQFPGSDVYKHVALSPDGKTLAVADGKEGAGDKIGLWDLGSGKSARWLAKHPGGAYSFAFSPDGKTLASGGGGNRIHFWDLAARKETSPIKTPPGRVTLIAFSPDGKTLASGDYLGRTILLWDVASRKRLHQLTRPSFVYTLAFSPDGTLLAAGAQEGPVSLWDVKTGKLVRELPGGPFVHAVTFSSDGKTLATAESSLKEGTRNTVGLWDVGTGKLLRRLHKSVGAVASVAFSADGKTLITGDGDSTIRLWDVTTGREAGPAPGNPAYVSGATMSPDRRTLAFIGSGDVRLVDLGTGRDIARFSGERGAFLSVAFSPDGKTLAAGAGRGEISLWEVATRKPIRRLKGDGRQIAPAEGCNSVAFSPDGRTLAAGVSDGTIRLWDVATGRQLRRLHLSHRADGSATVEAVSFSPDSKMLVASGRTEGEASRVRTWDALTGEELLYPTEGMRTEANRDRNRPLPPNSPEGIQFLPQAVFSPDGRTLVKNSQRGAIPVWEVASGQERCRLKGHQGAVICAAFTPDGRTLASAGWDNTIRLWDLETGRQLRRLVGHRGKANSLAFSADARTLVSGGDDTTLLFWDVADVTRRARPRLVRLSDREAEARWKDLGDADASKAYQAIKALSAAPEQAVPLLQKYLRPARTPDARQIARLIRDLDNDRFAVRRNATARLEELGDLAEPALRQRLAARPSADVRKRINQLLAELSPAAPFPLRVIRTIEVLERIGTPEARKFLNTLAGGYAGALLTREATAALRRQAKGPAATQ